MKRQVGRSFALAVLAAATLLGSASLVSASSGPYMVKDINPGGSSNPDYLTDLNGIAYFEAKGDGKGYELWRSDGTADGTWRVKDINPGSPASYPYGLAAIGNELFFGADDGVHGAELWLSDGTRTGTRMLKDLVPGGASSWPLGFTEYNGVVYFSAGVYSSGRQLWRTDGTASGTYPILASAANDNIAMLTSFGGKLYFVVSDNNGTGTLYRTNGTAAGTKPFKDSAGHAITGEFLGLTVVGSRLFFSVNRQKSDGWHGQLWRTNGTSASTRKLRDVTATEIEQITDLNGSAFFIVYGLAVETSAAELWKSDGTAATTVLVSDFGGESGGYELPSILAAVPGKLLLAAGYNGEPRLWTSDGTTAGTQPLVGAVEAYGAGVVLGGIAYFTAADDSGNCDALECLAVWRSDGTANGTYALGGPVASWYDLTKVGNSIYFAGAGDAHGQELWRYVP